MSGDRLAQIETAVEITLRRSRDSAGSEPEFVVAPSSVSCADVLALVEIAKAARPMANLPYPLSADERTQWLTRQGELRSALARLDSGATEGDA